MIAHIAFYVQNFELTLPVTIGVFPEHNNQQSRFMRPSLACHSRESSASRQNSGWVETNTSRSRHISLRDRKHQNAVHPLRIQRYYPGTRMLDFTQRPRSSRHSMTAVHSRQVDLDSGTVWIETKYLRRASSPILTFVHTLI